MIGSRALASGAERATIKSTPATARAIPSIRLAVTRSPSHAAAIKAVTIGIELCTSAPCEAVVRVRARLNVALYNPTPESAMSQSRTQGTGRGNRVAPPRSHTSDTSTREATQNRRNAKSIGGSSSSPLFVTTYVLPQINMTRRSRRMDDARPIIGIFNTAPSHGDSLPSETGARTARTRRSEPRLYEFI